MIQAFKNLNKKEVDVMLNAPVLVTILIAGADNLIDQDEQQGAIKLAKYRQFTENKVLHDYYGEVNKKFEKNLSKFIDYVNSFPSDAKERNSFISEELAKLNPILQKLSADFAFHFYESLKSFARHIAEASGGVLGYGSISPEEEKWIELNMINKPPVPANINNTKKNN